jgi:plasmid stabilization system protein ParE
MKSGYKIIWTDNALNELEHSIRYLEENWTEKELTKLAANLEKSLNLIS